jgi:hypothetical protein
MSSNADHVLFTRGDARVVVRLDSRDRVIGGQAGNHTFSGKNKTFQVQRYLSEGCASCRHFPEAIHYDHEVIVSACNLDDDSVWSDKCYAFRYRV